MATKSTRSLNERIWVEKKNRQSFRKHPLVNSKHRAHIYISHQFIFKPLFICGRSSCTRVCVCVSRWMWTLYWCERALISILFRASLARIGHKNLLIEVYRTKYAWIHSVRSLASMPYTFRFVLSISNAQMLQVKIRSRSIFPRTGSLAVCLFLLSICLSLLILIVMCFFFHSSALVSLLILG